MSSRPDPLDPRWVAALRLAPPAPDLDRAWAEVQERADGATAPPPPRGRWAAVAAAVVLLAAAVGAWRLAATDDRPDDRVLTDETAPPSTTGDVAGWERLPDPPLSPRHSPAVAQVGDEILVVGGDTWLCPPNADCGGAPEPLADGAAYDLASGEWRAIAPAPFPVAAAAPVVIGTDLYLTARSFGTDGSDVVHVLRYSVDADTWTELSTTGLAEPTWTSLVAAGETLVAVPSSDEGGAGPVVAAYDPDEDRWTALPDPPLPPQFDRSAVWAAPHLYVLGKELVPDPGSSEPSVVIGARLDPATGAWERLPDSEVIGHGLWLAEGDRLVHAALGRADGGGPGPTGWDRAYPEGGIYDIGAGAWRDLPRPDPDVPLPEEVRNGVADPGPTYGGVVGTDAASYGTPGGIVFDAVTETWATTLPAFPDVGLDGDQRTVVAAGRDAVIVGGQSWATGEGRLFDDAWIWRAP